jgi:hypothetical protein
VPKSALDFYPNHWGGPFGLKFHEPSSYVILNAICIKKEKN